jgi:glycosyltransferase involved in cell wall biosynthesis
MTTPTAPAGALFVVVPYFDEERWLSATLAALAVQSDTRFTLVLVDNASRDRSAAIAQEFARSSPIASVECISEPLKGTGAAADTGFRHAIARGAKWIARTDADCLPDRDWVRNIKRAFTESELEFIAGAVRARADEAPLSWIDRVALPAVHALIASYGRLTRRGPQYRYESILVVGNNLAISADLYLASGGFPRTRLEQGPNDRPLAEAVRQLTTRAALREDVVVYNSLRRLRAFGYLNTLRWYRNRGYVPTHVDIR